MSMSQDQRSEGQAVIDVLVAVQIPEAAPSGPSHRDRVRVEVFHIRRDTAGRDRRARSEYAFEDFVRARAAVRLASTFAMRSSRHRSPLEILFAGSARDFKWEGAVRRWCPSSRDPQRPGGSSTESPRGTTGSTRGSTNAS